MSPTGCARDVSLGVSLIRPLRRADTASALVYSATLSIGRDMLDERRKRLRFRAWRRGFREIDLILGGFADARFESLTETEVEAFEALLEAPDQDVYDWVVGRTPAPISHETPLLAAIRAHYGNA